MVNKFDYQKEKSCFLFLCFVLFCFVLRRLKIPAWIDICHPSIIFLLTFLPDKGGDLELVVTDDSPSAKYITALPGVSNDEQTSCVCCPTKGND